MRVEGRLRTIIGASFPDAPAVTDDTVDELEWSMWRGYEPEHAELGVPRVLGLGQHGHASITTALPSRTCFRRS
jgi:hypothetical protein